MDGAGCVAAGRAPPPTPITTRRAVVAKLGIPREASPEARMEVEISQEQSLQDPSPKEQRPPRKRSLRRSAEQGNEQDGKW